MKTKILMVATISLSMFSLTSHAARIYFKNVGEKPIEIQLVWQWLAPVGDIYDPDREDSRPTYIKLGKHQETNRFLTRKLRSADSQTTYYFRGENYRCKLNGQEINSFIVYGVSDKGKHIECQAK
jgi:hypothetical protein